MKWLRRIGYALAAALIAAGFGMLGRPARRQKKAEGQRDALLLDGSRKARDKADKARKRADQHQVDAQDAAIAGQAAIDKVGDSDESMAKLLDSWRSGDAGGV